MVFVSICHGECWGRCWCTINIRALFALYWSGDESSEGLCVRIVVIWEFGEQLSSS